MNNSLLKLARGTMSLEVLYNNHVKYSEDLHTYAHYDQGAGLGGFRPKEWISREDFDAAIATNTLWEVHLYPVPPHVWYGFYGSTLENAIKVAETELFTGS